jgi:hypothetical protein
MGISAAPVALTSNALGAKNGALRNHEASAKGMKAKILTIASSALFSLRLT